MAERRMLLNSTENFVGTMRIEYYCEDGKLYLGLNDNIKIIEEYFDDDSNGYYVVGFKKDLIVPEDFIDYSGYCEILLYSDYNIIFDTRSVYINNIQFFGNFTFNKQSIISSNITLYDYNYIFNNNCFDIDVDGIITFSGKIKQQYYKNTNNCKIYAWPYILYDLMKYNNIEEGNEKAQNYITLGNIRLTISSPTEYITTKPNIDLGNNNYIKFINNYMYDGNYITEYVCSNNITHLRKGITLPQNATVYIPDTVTDIASDTFKDESNIKKVVIFGNCRLSYLNGFENSSLETIEIYSDEIDTIIQYCFLHSNLQTITIPKSIKYIEPLAFDLLGDGYNFVINYKGTIEDWNDIHLSDTWYGVTKDIIVNCIDGSFVLNPYTLNTIYYTSVDDNIIDVEIQYTNNELLINDYNNKGELLFRNAINSITYLFNDKTQLTEVWLPNYNILSTVSAFYNCTNLVQINNSKQLKMIEEHTFGNCINLQQIEIDSDCIGDHAFNNCTSLSYVEISKRIKTIHECVFSDCTSLESINYEGTIEEWNNIDIDSSWHDGSAITTIHCSDGDIDLNAYYSVYYVSYNDDNKTDMIQLFKELFTYTLEDAKKDVEITNRRLKIISNYEEALNISHRINEYGKSYIIKL